MESKHSLPAQRPLSISIVEIKEKGFFSSRILTTELDPTVGAKTDSVFPIIVER